MDEFLSRAVAYLKTDASAGVASAVSLPRADAPVLLPMQGGLVVAYVVDELDGLVYVQQRHLDEAGMTPQQLHEIAMTNLGKLCAEKIEVRKHGLIYGVFVDGNFEASMFLLKSLWQRDMAHMVESGFAVIVPARDVMAFCDMDSQEGIAVLQQMVERVHANGDHLLSKNIFRLRKTD